jgi:preprotein translocase SecE subunit
MSTVAVKNPETSAPGLLDRLHVGTLAGVVYVLGSLAIVFELLPWLWWEAVRRIQIWQALREMMAARQIDEATALAILAGKPADHTAAATVLLVAVGVAVAGGLAYLGGRLLGQHPTPGVKAGIFTTLAALLLVVLLTRWASTWFEGMVYESRSLPSETFGIALTAGVAVVLLALLLRFVFLRPSFGPKMVAFEAQGWFSAISYKRNQGQRVRRGTILGVLVLVGCGIYALISHQTLADTKDWAINIPFTGKVQVTALGDAAVTLGDAVPKEGGEPRLPFTVDQGTFKAANSALKAGYFKIDEPKGAKDDVTVKGSDHPLKFLKNQVVSKDDYEKVRRALPEDKVPTFKAPEPAAGTTSYATLTLLPHVRYTLPLLLAALAIWLGWRVVNVPSFADFLIATEAELNKVSWTTRRRLIQDTIVVLVTVLLFTIFLFVVDVAWGQLLSWKRIGVLKLPEAGAENAKQEQNW